MNSINIWLWHGIYVKWLKSRFAMAIAAAIGLVSSQAIADQFVYEFVGPNWNSFHTFGSGDASIYGSNIALTMVLDNGETSNHNQFYSLEDIIRVTVTSQNGGIFSNDVFIPNNGLSSAFKPFATDGLGNMVWSFLSPYPSSGGIAPLGYVNLKDSSGYNLSLGIEFSNYGGYVPIGMTFADSGYLMSAAQYLPNEGPVDSISGTPLPVPEADSYTYIALGMGLVGWLSRRRG